jgi:SAM-dependent methyltransferase
VNSENPENPANLENLENPRTSRTREPMMRMYSDLASWWPLLSAPADYAEEAESFVSMMELQPATRPTLLELGAGGGNLASHLKAHVTPTLTDISPGMLAVSRALNPELEHIQGDMRTLRLSRAFDIVLIHDAIMYCTTLEELRAALATAAAHCRSGGLVIVAPDEVRETWAPETSTGGEDGADGRALRYLEWSWDPDPADTTCEVAYTIVTRDADGRMDVVLDRHVEGLFAEAEWLTIFREAGLATRVVRDVWNRHVFVGRKET